MINKSPHIFEVVLSLACRKHIGSDIQNNYWDHVIADKMMLAKSVLGKMNKMRQKLQY